MAHRSPQTSPGISSPAKKAKDKLYSTEKANEGQTVFSVRPREAPTCKLIGYLPSLSLLGQKHGNTRSIAYVCKIQCKMHHDKQLLFTKVHSKAQPPRDINISSTNLSLERAASAPLDVLHIAVLGSSGLAGLGGMRGRRGGVVGGLCRSSRTTLGDNAIAGAIGSAPSGATRNESRANSEGVL
jgi:hypothetical protein